MTDNNDYKDKLLEDFFAARRHEVADNGFTRRVMRRLPQRHNRLAQVWNTLCILLAAAMFVAVGGVQVVWATLQEAFIGLVEQGATADVDPRSLLIAGGVLLFLGYRKIASLA